ncbi:hypothetical protein OSB04_028556 [Centaurea solstitialis]|uniref:Transposase n=1 Tax=Centaurea solstitialis TaxID=347529 RepID=A0AA38STE9_9ASTR|nr:hypothetical protein OSB04_028556 [Centaurea solstitialis]
MSISQIRMSRRCFTKLCHMLEILGGLKPSKNMNIDEQVAIFLHILAHNVKNRVIISRFHRSGETISRHFARVCNATIRLHNRLLKKPEPVPDNSTDQRWKWFKNCLGALDGTYIKCLVPIEEKPRYRTRKNDIATNVLGVCSQDMQFIYVLTGWEGSAADGRVLRDALLRPHGLKVPWPGYYLVDAGYTNGEGFLAPYRGQRYHLNEWRDGHQPTTAKEFFNMKHSSARNVIERRFGILKGRWGILKDNSYYPIDTKNKIIMACCLLHNFIRQEMEVDPFDDEGDNDLGTGDLGDDDVDNISSIGTSNEWTTFRDNLAESMGWSTDEESKLVEALVNMTNTGTFKADNGFKVGYLQHLEEALKVSLPNSNLLANPHISSKMKTIKRDWQCVYDMVNGSNTSGFGYDPERKCVTAEESVWEAYLQVHKDATRWKNKSFPHYEDLCIVFGKDRAQGNRARDFVEMEQEVNVEETQESDDDLLDSDNAASRNTNLQNDEASPSVISRKRKSRSDDGFNNAVGLITESLKEISKDLSQGIKFDMKINEMSDKIPSEIFKLTSLTQTEKFKALTKIRGDSVNLQNFWQMGEEHREAWVKYIVEHE